MKLGILGGLAAATALVGSMASAAPVNYVIDLFIGSSPNDPSLVDALNPVGIATLTYDTAGLGWNFVGVGSADPSLESAANGTFDFSIEMFGGTAFAQTFTNTDDLDAGLTIDFGFLGGTGNPLTFDLAITEPTVAINNPQILGFASLGGGTISNSSNGSNPFSMQLLVDSVTPPPPPAVIPLPAPFLLLGAGIVGLGLRSKLRKKEA